MMYPECEASMTTTVRLTGCNGCRCCPARACEPGEPLGPGICGDDCPCNPDYEDGVSS